ncbi:NADPH-dependent aldehyde reductase Ahr [Neorhodopirellula lusitana]|uniref:NADPH-dependent aldehyde reductase Ahr n=1 Tax=Neorhodopirellula lusitana TaxID=445327 RepID=UPI00384B853B
MTTIHAYAVKEAGGALEPFEYQVGPLGHDEVEIDVTSCGICHSDISMIDNEWGMTEYPLVPGHEITGTIAAIGAGVDRLKVGQTVGLGWSSGSCMTCHQCMSGDHNLCGDNEGTIVGRHGGFADKVRCQKAWAIPLPDGIDPKKAGPLFCGGLTVFNPIVQFDVRPTHRVGVVGIGGLGHLALQFLNKWGCEVTAFTSSASKAEEAKSLGAHKIINSRSDSELTDAAGSFDFILSTVAVTLDWEKYFAALAQRGRLHVVGAALEPIPAAAFPLIAGQKSLSGSPIGSPATAATMLEFCARHDIEATTEHFPMSDVNEALDHLRAGNAKYRIVLDRT